MMTREEVEEQVQRDKEEVAALWRQVRIERFHAIASMAGVKKAAIAGGSWEEVEPYYDAVMEELLSQGLEEEAA